MPSDPHAATPADPAEPDAYAPFAYLTAPNAPLYRRVMRALVAEKERFAVHVRPEQVHGALRSDGGEPVAEEAVADALEKLSQPSWGNLLAFPDSSRVTALEDFYRRRMLYQLSRAGEAAERAIARYDDALGTRGALQAVALEDIVVLLNGLRDRAAEHAADPATEPDSAAIRRYRRAPEVAVTAAFEVLREPGTVKANNPWAYVTHVVKLSMRAQNRADGLLCSDQKARRLMRSDHRDVVRFGEREQRTWDVELEAVATADPERPSEMPAAVEVAVRKLVDLLVELGWPRDVVELGVEYICSRLADAAGAQQAFNSLRRDLTPLSLLGIGRRSWVALCRAVLLGSDSSRAGGVLRRLVVGEETSALLSDDGLVKRLVDARPATLDDARPAMLGAA